MTDNINIEKPLPIKTYNVSKVNEKLKRLEEAIESGGSGGVTPEEVQTMIDTSLTDYPDNTDLSTALADKQDVLTAGTGIDITNNIISTTAAGEWELFTGDRTTLVANNLTLKDILMEYHASTDEIEALGYVPKGARCSAIGTKFMAISYSSSSVESATSTFDPTSGNVLLQKVYHSTVGSGINATMLYHSDSTSYSYYREGITTRYVKLYVRD